MARRARQSKSGTILIATPTYGDKLLAATGESVASQSGVTTEWRLFTDQVAPPPDMRNVVAAYQAAWQVALDGDYAALLTLEHDMVLPDEHAIRRMVDTDGDVVFAPYCHRSGSHALNLVTVRRSGRPGDTLTDQPALLDEYEARGWGPVGGVGWGCTLIRRNVLEQIDVRCERPGVSAGDLEFAADALAANFRLVACMSAGCWHVTDGAWVHPTLGIRHGVRVRARRKFWVMLTGRYRRVTAGDVFDVDERMAREFLDKGIVDRMNGDDNG